jgi:tetratricopeptide (TPR) repeat protein
VLVKALAPDPERRYGSAGELAAELRAHLDGRPVTARAPSLRYRVGRFVARHRAAVAGAAAIGVLLAGLVAVSVDSALSTRRQARRVAAERDRAEAERAEAVAVRSFMEDVLLSADPTAGLGPDATILEGLDRIVERYGDDPISESSAVDAAVRLAIGNVFARLGRFDEAEAALRPTYEVCVERLGPKHQVTCNALRLLAELARARGNVEEAELACSELLSLEGALNPFERFDALTLRAQARTDLERFDGARADLEAAADALDAPEAPRWWRAQLLFAAERLFTAWQRPDELERFRARLAP